MYTGCCVSMEYFWRSEIFVCIVKGKEKGLIEIRCVLCVFDRKLLEFLLMFTVWREEGR